MAMHPRDIIDRIASLDEATVAEPTTEPTEAPPTEIPTERPSRRPSRSPWTMPPDMEPGQEPRPKAEDEAAEIEGWLEATEQPIRDWDWDGNELRLALDDGTTEVYTRGQLEEIGVFGGQMAFAESEEPDNDQGLPPMPDDDQAINDFATGEGEAMVAAGEDEPKMDADGTLDMILGRTPTPAEPAAGGEGTIEVIQIDGSQAGEIMGAVSDLVKAIIGTVGGSEEGGDEGEDKKGKKKEKDSEGEKGKSKKEKKSKDKKEDKSEDKDDDKKDDDKE